MKRFLLMFCVFVLLVCMMTGCAGRKLSDAPTSEEIKKIIPAEAKLDITDYPMLNENIPDPREIIREIPEEYRSFSFIPEEWELTENFRTEKYYTSRSDSNIRLFVYDDINDTFYTVYSAFDHPEMDLLFAYSYDSDGRLTGYNNYQNGILYSTDNGGYANLTIPVEHVVYQYVYSDGTLEYCSADINPNASLNALDREIPAEDCHGYAFSYYPYDKHFENLSYKSISQYYEYNYSFFEAFYTEDGKLDSIQYHDPYSEKTTFVCIYDKNYELAECYLYNIKNASTRNLYSSAKQK